MLSGSENGVPLQQAKNDKEQRKVAEDSMENLGLSITESVSYWIVESSNEMRQWDPCGRAVNPTVSQNTCSCKKRQRLAGDRFGLVLQESVFIMPPLGSLYTRRSSHVSPVF